MAVSGSKNFSVTRTDIVGAALRKVGAFDSGDTIDDSDSSDTVLALNLMVKEWSARGIDVPWREEVTLFLQYGTESYLVGPSGGHATAAYVETTLASSAAALATTISLTSTTGMSNGDYIGIKLDDGSLHWTTITTVGTTLIASGLASAAASGNTVYAYTTKANRPQKIVYAYRRDADGNDTPVELIGDIAYRGLSDKDATGIITQCFYQPTLTNGKLFVWQTGGPDKLILICQPLVDDFDSASNNPQFPIEWANAIVWNLAVEIAPEYGVSVRDRQALKLEARDKLETVLDYDVENASVILGVEA